MPATSLILNVDDTEAGRYAKSRALRAAGFEIMEAATGGEALDLVEARRPALVLLDVKLPDISGLEVCRRIKRDHPGIVVLQVSASYTTGGDRVRGLDSGADAYLTQPVEAGELVASVRALLRLRRAEAGLRAADERLGLLLEGATDYAVITVDDDGRIVSWSPGAAAVFGWTAEEAVGRPVDITFTEEDRARGEPRREIETARREGLANDERWHRAKDGRPVFMNGSVRPLHDADGRERGFIKIARDETERRRAEEVNGRLATIVNASGDAIISFAAEDGHILTWNRGAEATFGYTEAEAVGAPVSLLLPTAGMRQWEDRTGVFNRVMAEGSVETESVRRRKDGALIDVAITAARMDGPDGRVLGVSGIFRDITARKRTEARLRELNERLEGLVAERTADRDRMWRLSTDLMLVARFDSGIEAVNPAWRTLLGRGEEELVGTNFLDLVHPDDLGSTASEAGRLAEGHTTLRFQNRYRHRDGSYRWLSWTAVPDEGLIHAVGRDVTAERAAAEALARAEEQLRQSQKMEAVGQLTGGIAHDFNNLLQIVTGNLEILARNLPEDGPRLRRLADNAMTGARRAATLTQRLLAFSRRQPLDPKPVNVNALVAGMQDLLARTLGETIALETVLAGGLWRVETDPNQLESALINLAVNARDAMPEGGKLTIEVANVHLDQGYAAHNAEVAPGAYVMICVSDTGTGMDAATAARVFEPFFTTKEVGKGTGLGLSMVYGFVKQSGGHVKLYSEPGQGTSVKLYLPRLVGEVAEEAPEAQAGAPEGSPTETVLVVEDDADVRAHSAEVLRELGYRVLEAPDGPSALDLLGRQGERPVDLLFSDVVLPGGLNGAQLAERARLLQPSLRVLFTTGYARNAIVHHGRLDPGVQLITKPFTYTDLAAKVRDMLDAPAG